MLEIFLCRWLWDSPAAGGITHPGTLAQEEIQDDVIKWKLFPRYWPFVREIHRCPVNSLHKGQWRRALIFSCICAPINAWVNNGEASDLRHHRVHYDFIVMLPDIMQTPFSNTFYVVQIHFMLKKCVQFDWNFAEACFSVSNWQQVTIGRRWLGAKITTNYLNQWCTFMQ